MFAIDSDYRMSVEGLYVRAHEGTFIYVPSVWPDMANAASAATLPPGWA